MTATSVSAHVSKSVRGEYISIYMHVFQTATTVLIHPHGVCVCVCVWVYVCVRE